MNVHTFRGRTLAEARRAATAEIGADAVFLAARTVRRPSVAGWFGGSEFEVEAAPAASRPEPRAEAERGPFAAAVYTPSAPAGQVDVSALRAELKGDIRALRTMLAKTDGTTWVGEEIAALRELVETFAETTTKSDRATTRLRGIGVEGPALTALVRAAKSEGNGPDALRAALAAVVPVADWPLSQKRALVALVGPAGVGKTTTAAKLAARARLEGRTVTLIGCDTFRIGAVEQLARYGELLDAHVVTAKTPAQLRRAVEEATTELVVIDTSGRIPSPDTVESALPSIGGATSTRQKHVLLCAPASLRAHDATRLARRYGRLSPTALVVTKLDETESPAGLVHATWATKLPVAVLCAGPRVPEDVDGATAELVAGYLAPRGKGRTAA